MLVNRTGGNLKVGNIAVLVEVLLVGVRVMVVKPYQQNSLEAHIKGDLQIHIDHRVTKPCDIQRVEAEETSFLEAITAATQDRVNLVIGEVVGVESIQECRFTVWVG